MSDLLFRGCRRFLAVCVFGSLACLSASVQAAATAPSTQPALKIQDARAKRLLAALPRWSSPNEMPRTFYCRILMYGGLGRRVTFTVSYAYQAPDRARLILSDDLQHVPLIISNQAGVYLFDPLRNSVLGLGTDHMPAINVSDVDNGLRINWNAFGGAGQPIRFDLPAIIKSLGGELYSKTARGGAVMLVDQWIDNKGRRERLRITIPPHSHIPSRITSSIDRHGWKLAVEITDIYVNRPIQLAKGDPLAGAKLGQSHGIQVFNAAAYAKQFGRPAAMEQFMQSYGVILTVLSAESANLPGASQKSKHMALQSLKRIGSNMTVAQALAKAHKNMPAWRNYVQPWITHVRDRMRAAATQPTLKPLAHHAATQPMLTISDARAGKLLASLSRWPNAASLPRTFQMQLRVIKSSSTGVSFVIDYMHRAPNHTVMVLYGPADRIPLLIATSKACAAFDPIHQQVVVGKGPISQALSFYAADGKPAFYFAVGGANDAQDANTTFQFDLPAVIRGVGGTLSSHRTKSRKFSLVDEYRNKKGKRRRLSIVFSDDGSTPAKIQIEKYDHGWIPEFVISDIRINQPLTLREAPMPLHRIEHHGQFSLKVVGSNGGSDGAGSAFTAPATAALSAVPLIELQSSSEGQASPAKLKAIKDTLKQYAPGLTAQQLVERYSKLRPAWLNFAHAWLAEIHGKKPPKLTTPPAP